MSIMIPISAGELLDKLTILEIKSDKLDIGDDKRHVDSEISILSSIAEKVNGIDQPRIEELCIELKSINLQLWEVEDSIRLKEFLREFDQEFIKLSRSVYRLNDQRASIKKLLNVELESDIREVKLYTEYND